MVIISQNDKAGYMLCGRFGNFGSYRGHWGLLRTRIRVVICRFRAAGMRRGMAGLKSGDTGPDFCAGKGGAAKPGGRVVSGQFPEKSGSGAEDSGKYAA